MHRYVFFFTTFVSSIYEPLHARLNGGVLVFLLHILNTTNITLYFNYENAENVCFTVYFVAQRFIAEQHV